ncbi:MAG: methionyl-tRNA formyltransferase [Patescibacteria group bacterium]|nr:methionyl-tRNA formyltransferase [Patescibacteria group bacterium]MBU1953296.1 methionyl-tRNA formyltransferase [Patescibacteria group bacterium]
MKKNLNVVFFGTSDRSISILKSLKKSFNLQLCVTKTDTKVGRNQEKRETAVKKWAIKNSIKFAEVSSLKDKDLEQVAKQIEKLKPDFGVVTDFSYIIPPEIIKIFDTKLINIHFSLLPKYRGASPVQFSILNGDEMTGITFYIVDERMDTGNIISQIGYKMCSKETSGELYDILFKIAADKLPEILEKYSLSQITPLPQDKESATYTFSKTHPKSTFIYKEDAQINWVQKPEEIERMIRAFNPWPIAWSYLKDLEKTKCLSNSKINMKETVNKNLKVKIYSSDVVEEKLSIKELQIEGKNKMTWEDFKNGYLAPVK